MKHTPDKSNIDSRLFGMLLTPSWGSAITDISLSIALVIVSIATANHQVNNLKTSFLTFQSMQPKPGPHSLSSGLLSNTFIANLPLLLVWALVGLVVYLFAENVLRAIKDSVELKDEMNYVNVDRHSLISSVIKHLLARLIVLIVWIGYIIFFFHQVLPYCVAAAVAGSSQANIFENCWYIFVALAVMSLALHIHTVLLRLLLLRPRAFSRQLYIY